MLAPRASSAFICIRCELRLARPRVPPVSYRASHASFSTSTPRRDTLEQSENASQLQKSRSREKLSGHPLGKLRKRRGKAAIRESTAQLKGVKTLGKDSKILVLEEVGDAPKRRDEPASSEQESPEDSPSVLASLQAQSTEVGQDEIDRQLNSLRPRTHSNPDEPHYIPRAAFRQLNKTLLDGFTVQQLSRYYATSQVAQDLPATKKKEDGLKQQKGTGKKPVERTKWYSGVTPLSRRLPGGVIQKGTKRKPVNKPLLVDQILRHLWNVELLEEIEAPGEVEMTLKPWQLGLLNTGAPPTALDRIGSMRKAKIEIDWSSSVLRITADKSSAEYAADDIEHHLRNTEVQKFFVDRWSCMMQEDEVPKGKLVDIFPGNSLKTVGRLTATMIQAVSDNTLSIRGLDKDSVHEAQRNLIKLLPLRQSTDTVENSKLNAEKDSYMVPCPLKNLLGYRYRSLDLGRWTFPVATRLGEDSNTFHEVPSDADNSSTDIPVADADTVTLQTNVLDVLSRRHVPPPNRPKVVKTSDKNSSWVELPNRLSAHFGHALFPTNHDLQSPAQTDFQTNKSAFLTAIPGVPRIITDDVFGRPTTIWRQLLQYEFEASPYQQNQLENFRYYPRLALRFSSDNQPHLVNVSIIFNTYSHIVLLPDQATDISFWQAQRLGLKKPLEHASIREFADAICANIQSGGRLAAPPELKIEIPRWTIPGYSRGNHGTRTVTYLSTGITHQQGFTGDYNGFSLSYGMQQKGKLDGRGGKLGLFFKAPNSKQDESDGMQMKGFVRSAFELAGRITEATTSTVPLSQVVRTKVPVLAGEDKIAQQGQGDQEAKLDLQTSVEQGGLSNPATESIHVVNIEVGAEEILSEELGNAKYEDGQEMGFSMQIGNFDLTEKDIDLAHRVGSKEVVEETLGLDEHTPESTEHTMRLEHASLDPHSTNALHEDSHSVNEGQVPNGEDGTTLASSA